MSDSQRILNELKVAREQAARLLAALRETSALSGSSGPRDLYKKVTGQSSMERAVAAASRTLESYDRMIEEVQGGHVPDLVTMPSRTGAGRMTFAALYNARTA